MDVRTRKYVWCRLAELFFLDTGPDEKDFEQMAQLLKNNGWSRIQTEALLIEIIAVHVKYNLGMIFYPFLAWPVIGEWAGFNQEWLSKRIHHTIALRKCYPKWYFSLSDWSNRKLMQKLGIQRLLEKL